MEPLNWTLEKTARPTDEEGIIYEQVINKAPDYYVAVFDGATVDAEASAADGRVRYKNVPMIAVRPVGERDFVSRPMSDDDRRRFPRAIAAFEARKANASKRMPLELLPGITAADLAEFEEIGIRDANALPDMAELPANLEPFRSMAKRLASLSKPRLRLVDGQLKEVAA